MSRNKKPRKAYRPTLVLADPMGAMTRPMPAASRDKAMLQFRTALTSMERDDHPGLDAWRQLSDAINLTETLMNGGHLLASEVAQTIADAITAMAKAGIRHSEGKRMGLDGPGIQAIRDVLDIVEQCLTEFEAIVIERAKVETARRLRPILRNKKLADTQVVCL